MRFFLTFKVSGKDYLSYQISAIQDDEAHKEGTLTSYCQVFNYLLKPYSTDVVIAHTQTNTMTYKHHRSMSVVRYLETFREKETRRGRV